MKDFPFIGRITYETHQYSGNTEVKFMKSKIAKTIVTMAVAVLAAGTTVTTAQAAENTPVQQTWCNPDGSCDVDGVCTIGGYCDGAHWCDTNGNNGSHHEEDSHHGNRSGHHSGRGHHH